MKKKSIWYSLLLSSFALIIFSNFKKLEKQNLPITTDVFIKPIAVLELFTSQGCSSCQSADKLLSKTINLAKKENKNIFALSFHVDYWNRLGWKDPFSDKTFSDRQKNYPTHFNIDGVYTPQLVVNGDKEFVG